jgi:hypothetical protein
MSKENVEIVRAMLAPFEGVDVIGIDWESEEIRQTLQRDYSPDVELTTLESAVGSGPSASYRGWDGLVRYLKEWFEPFSEYRMEWLDFIDVGDFVLVPMRARGTGGASGIDVNMELTLSYELRDGLIRRMGQYDSVEQARRTVAP